MRRKETYLLLAFLLCLYLGVGAGIYLSQASIIFRSEGPYATAPRHLDIQDLFIDTQDGERLYAWWLRTPGATKTVLFFQENGRNISFRRQRWLTFARMGVNALMIDYRGFGKSSGRMRKEADIYSDGHAAWVHLTRSRQVAPDDIIVWGRSLGGAVAAHIAQHKAIAALVLESTFSSLDAMARRQYWFYPTRLLLKFHFPSIDHVRQVSSPVIVIHSEEDRYIPFKQAAALFGAANAPKTMLAVTGSHDDLFERDVGALSRLTRILDAGAVDPDRLHPSAAAF